MTNDSTRRQNALPEETIFNLSDFALFLSVMKNKPAYENTLSIIMNDPSLRLKVWMPELAVQSLNNHLRYYQRQVAPSHWRTQPPLSMRPIT